MPAESAGPALGVAWVLSLGLFLLAGPDAPQPGPVSPRPGLVSPQPGLVSPQPGSECPRPSEVSSVEGRTLAVACRRGQGAPLRGPARILFGQRLDPNRAAASTLEILPGIGSARAAAIVAERRRRPFGSVEELQRVHGLGPRTVARLGPWLAVKPVPSCGDAANRPALEPRPGLPARRALERRVRAAQLAGAPARHAALCRDGG